MSGITSIAFAPELPVVLLAVLAAISVVLVGFALYRRAAGVGWRALALAGALAALLGPSLIEEERDPLTDVAVIVVDQSPSQSIDPRTERTRAALSEIERKLQRYDDLEVRVVAVGNALDESEEIETAALPADGTRLFSAVERALTDVPSSRIAGTILITDGQVHDAPKDPEAAKLPGPIHVLLTGEPGEADRRIVVERMPAYGIVGQMLEITLKVDEPPAADGTPRQARISIRRDGGRTDTYPVPVGISEAIPFEVAHGGPNVLEIEVEPGPAELTLQNNRAVIVVNGVRDRLRVLLVSGEPHAGERVWRNLLKADPSVDLVHFTILRPPEKQDGTPINELSLIAFPIRELFEIKLEEFDLIIFDRYRRRGVLPHAYLDNIAQYVQRGGALLEAAGPAFATPLSLYRTPLALVLPGAPTGEVYIEAFRPALTSQGRRHPVTSDLPGADKQPPWGRWFRMVAAEPTRGATLLSGVNDKPVLILDRNGEGRVAQLLSDQVWLWARGFEGGGPQAELLRRVAHWLMKEPDLEEEDLRAGAHGRRLEIARRSLQPETAPVTVTTPSGRTFEVMLEPGEHGIDAGAAVISESGLYHLSDGRRDTVVAIGPINPKEFADPRTSAAVLQPTVEATGGGIFWLAKDGLPDIRRVRPDRAAVGRDWLGLRANRDYVVTGLRQVPLLPPWLVLALLLGGLILAWRREGA